MAAQADIADADVQIINVVNPAVEEIVDHAEVVISPDGNDVNRENVEVMELEVHAEIPVEQAEEHREEPSPLRPAEPDLVPEPKPLAVHLAYLNDSEDSDPGNLCAICYQPYTNSGEHRLSCLKCGHLFGEGCIRHWLRVGCNSTARRCPSCNMKAKLNDIRILYTKNLIALDTTEKNRLERRVEQVLSEKNIVQAQLNAASLQISFLTNRIREQEQKIKTLKENAVPITQPSLLQKCSNFSAKIQNIFTLCSDGGSRVLAHSSHLSLLVASQSSGNSLFAGSGIRKMNTLDLKPMTFYSLHKKHIRDMVFSEREHGTLLSVSLDCTAKLFDVESNIVVQTFQAPDPLWSCCWNSMDGNKLYCGSQKGVVFVFDKRQPRTEPEQIIETVDAKDKSGIISICHIPPKPGRFMPNGGILVCKLSQIVAYYQSSGDKFESKVLPIEGTFMSMRYYKATDHLLISAKASLRWPTSRHILCQLSKTHYNAEESDETIDILHTFYGSGSTSALSRSSFVQLPNKDLTVCCYNFRNLSMDMWSVASSKKIGINDVHFKETVLDFCSFATNNKEMIMPCLSDTKLSVIQLNFD